MGYWEKCVEEAFEEVGIVATEDKIVGVACYVSNAYSRKVSCSACGGTGVHPHRPGKCWKCGGSGRRA